MKNKIPWNKGLTKYTDIRVRKIATKMKNRELSPETRKKLVDLNSGAKNPFFGRKHTDKTKEMMSKKAQNRFGPCNPMFGRRHSELAKARIRYARSKQKVTFTSSQEVKIMMYLSKLGYKYEGHKYMKIAFPYQCDIYVPKLNLIIECDGAYFHNYPHGLPIDHCRTLALHDKGYKILRLWDFEINGMQFKHFKALIEKYKYKVR